MLNLDPGRWPRWRVSDEAPLTLWPSVDMETNGRCCHYVIHHGHVTWVHSDGLPRTRPFDRLGRSR